ncbi:MAG: site-2 protease family protein, partial [Roseiflexaceae bacterium]
MRNLYYVTTIRGMPIRVHYTWLVVVLLGIPVLTNVAIPASLPEIGGLARLALALIVLALFFLVVGIHELAHLLTARLFKVRIPTLNLYPLGAVTRLASRHSDAKAAFWVAAAGPITSIALWWLLSSITAAGAVAPWLAVVLGIVGQLSLYLGLINLIPGLPLDGGRMLRAVLWGVSGSFESATKIARILGQIGAYGLMFWGALILTRESGWLLAGAMIVVGWAIREAGGTTYRRSLVAQHLRQLTAADVLGEPKRAASPEQTLRSFALMLRGRTGNAPVPVIANGMFLG